MYDPFTKEQLDCLRYIAERYRLSRCEFYVFIRVFQGKTNKQIGKELFLTEKTIKYHLGYIYSKTRIHSRIQVFSLILDMEWPQLTPKTEKYAEFTYHPNERGKNLKIAETEEDKEKELPLPFGSSTTNFSD